MIKTDWLKYCGNTPYTYNGLNIGSGGNGCGVCIFQG